MKTKQVVTQHSCSDTADIGVALIEHQFAARAAGIKPASVEQQVHLELVSLVSGTLTISTRTGEVDT